MTTSSAPASTRPVRLSYAAHYPRDFANEYDVFAGTPTELDQLAAIIESWTHPGTFHLVTRKRAIQLGVTRVNQAKKYSEQWFGGFSARAYLGRDPETLAEMIEQAHKSTLQVIMEHEAAQEYDRAEQEYNDSFDAN